MMVIKCDVCGNDFTPGNDLYSEIPNGVGFMIEGGYVFNVCSPCICTQSMEHIEHCIMEWKKNHEC